MEEAWSLFWKMGPLITLGAEEEPGGVPCISSQPPTEALTLQGGEPRMANLYHHPSFQP